MTNLLKTLPLMSLLAFAAPVNAQETEGTATEEEATPDPLALSVGVPEETEAKVGDIYILEQFKAWDLRCVVAEEGQVDPCQLYQLLQDENGVSIAEINIFPLIDSDPLVAGSTIVTPLETLLTEQLGISVDGGKVAKYPFSWCSKIGCFSRVGFTAAEITAFQRGANASLVIVPVVAPDQKVRLNASLSGFTAAYRALQKNFEESGSGASQ